jgi:FHS family L-fucose permease-like MFS transporter
MAIVGGALMPILQGAIIDMKTIGGFAAVNISFVLPFICFTIIAFYGYRTLKVHK